MQNLEEEEEESTMSMSMSTTTLKNILPHNVVVDILSRLPVKSLLRFRCVSKPWKIFFSDPSFIKRHLKHSINNYEHVMLTSSLFYDSPVFNDACFYSIAANNSNESSSLADEAVGIDFPFKTYGYRAEILGSCNGLLLINPYEDIYCIWNPFTKEFKKLPDTPIEFPKTNRLVYHRMMIYGFGYDKIIEDYKVVRIVRFDDGAHTEVKVYILGLDSWSRIQDMPNYFAGQSVAAKLLGGKFVNGAVHWVGHKHSASYYKDDENVLPRSIISFNIEDEQYREMQQPNFADRDSFYPKVELLDGCLCMVCHYDKSSDTCFDLWVMRDYGVKDSWIKQFTIAQTTFIQNLKYVSVKPLKVTKNGELLLLFDNGNTSLVVYDPKHGTAKTLKISGMKGYFETHTFVESLISLNSGTFVGQEQAVWRRTLETLQNKNKRKRPRGWWKDGL